MPFVNELGYLNRQLQRGLTELRADLRLAGLLHHLSKRRKLQLERLILFNRNLFRTSSGPSLRKK